MAIVAVTANVAEGSGTSFSVDCGSGADRFLLAFIGMQGGSATSVEYNGVAMTLMGTIGTQYGADHARMYGLVNPASGSNTFSFSSGSPTTGPYSICLPFTGVDQTSVAGATRDTDTLSHEGGSTTHSLSGVQATDYSACGVHASYIYSDSNSFSNLTEHAEGQGTNDGSAFGGDLNVSGPNYTFSQFGASVAVALIEAAAAGGLILPNRLYTPPFRTLLAR